MKYSFVCTECDHAQVEEHKVSELDHLKEDGVICEVCGGRSKYVFDPSGCQICFTG